jgi:hypothetical protein
MRVIVRPEMSAAFDSSTMSSLQEWPDCRSDSVHASAHSYHLAVWKVDDNVHAVEVVCVRRETGCNRIDLLDEEEVAMFFAYTADRELL